MPALVAASAPWRLPRRAARDGGTRGLMAATLAAGRVRSSPTTRPPFSGASPRREAPVEVTVPGTEVRGRRAPVHRRDHPADATRRHGIPVTSAARALLDLAATAPTKTSTAPSAKPRATARERHSLNQQFSRYPHHRANPHSQKRCDPSQAHRSNAERLMLKLTPRSRSCPTLRDERPVRGPPQRDRWKARRTRRRGIRVAPDNWFNFYPVWKTAT